MFVLVPIVATDVFHVTEKMGDSGRYFGCMSCYFVRSHSAQMMLSLRKKYLLPWTFTSHQ